MSDTTISLENIHSQKKCRMKNVLIKNCLIPFLNEEDILRIINVNKDFRNIVDELFNYKTVFNDLFRKHFWKFKSIVLLDSPDIDLSSYPTEGIKFYIKFFMLLKKEKLDWRFCTFTEEVFLNPDALTKLLNDTRNKITYWGNKQTMKEIFAIYGENSNIFYEKYKKYNISIKYNINNFNDENLASIFKYYPGIFREIIVKNEHIPNYVEMFEKCSKMKKIKVNIENNSISNIHLLKKINCKIKIGFRSFGEQIISNKENLKDLNIRKIKVSEGWNYEFLHFISCVDNLTHLTLDCHEMDANIPTITNFNNLTCLKIDYLKYPLLHNFFSGIKFDNLTSLYLDSIILINWRSLDKMNEKEKNIEKVKVLTMKKDFSVLEEFCSNHPKLTRLKIRDNFSDGSSLLFYKRNELMINLSFYVNINISFIIERNILQAEEEKENPFVTTIFGLQYNEVKHPYLKNLIQTNKNFKKINFVKYIIK